ncbi:hypothetical protein T492DRAFT_849072 [Pavlovales sp. CCMP2436]|nr:hypothetical protein T492DRAFT_849072 [Pavlovales sp. CCMP2436]
MLALTDPMSSRTTHQPEPNAEKSSGARFAEAYSRLYSTSVGQFLLSVVLVVLFALANLSFFAPGEQTQQRLVYSLVGFFGSLIAMLSSTVIFCCSFSTSDHADSGQLMAFVMLNIIAIVVLVVGAVMMLAAAKSTDQLKGLIGWSVALSFLTVVEASATSYFAVQAVNLHVALDEHNAAPAHDHDAGML